MNNNCIQVVMVDDHEVLRVGLTLTLRADPCIQVVGEGCNGVEAIHLCEQLHPDVLLLDLRMPVMDGLTAARHIRQLFPELPILVLTSYMDQDLIKAALSIGVKGYLSKDISAAALTEAVRAVHSGQSMLAGPVIQQLIDEMRQLPSPAIKVHLTQREREILYLVIQGKTNQEIADRLVVAFTTVKRHVANILEKLDVHTRTEAAVLAIQYHLVES